MRRFLLLLLGFWLGGIALGVAHVLLPVNLLLVLAAAVLVKRILPCSWQFLIALVAVSLLGSIWGRVPTSKATLKYQPSENKITTVVEKQLLHVLPEPEASFVVAMLLGEQKNVSPTLIKQLRRTGTSHILAISGLNISIIAGIIFLVLLLAPVSLFWRSVITAGLLWGYLFLIGHPLAATRATIFWTLVLLARNLNLLVSLPTIIILTLATLVSYSPSLLANLSFQLSVSAVAGIGLMLFLYRPRGILLALATSLGAMLTTWPIIAYRFGSIAPIGLLANLLVEPVFPLLMLVSMALLAVSFLLAPAALAGSFIIHLLYGWLDSVTRVLATIPGGYIDRITLPIWGIFFYYTALISASILTLRYQHRSWREVWE